MSTPTFNQTGTKIIVALIAIKPARKPPVNPAIIKYHTFFGVACTLYFLICYSVNPLVSSTILFPVIIDTTIETSKCTKSTANPEAPQAFNPIIDLYLGPPLTNEAKTVNK